MLTVMNQSLVLNEDAYVRPLPPIQHGRDNYLSMVPQPSRTSQTPAALTEPREEQNNNQEVQGKREHILEYCDSSEISIRCFSAIYRSFNILCILFSKSWASANKTKTKTKEDKKR